MRAAAQRLSDAVVVVVNLANAMPFWQAKPDDNGWSLSGRSATSRPSSTAAIMPHSGSQIRQNVGLFSMRDATRQRYCKSYSWYS